MREPPRTDRTLPPAEVAARPARKVTHKRWYVLAALLGIAFTVWALARYQPPFPDRLTLELQLGPEFAGSEPLVATGKTGAGDLLYLRRGAGDTIVFGYDSWGESNPPVGSPVSIRQGERLELEIRMAALSTPRGHYGEQKSLLEVKCNGATVLSGPTSYYAHDPGSVYFGVNTIGAGSAGPRLHGALTRPDGRTVGEAGSQFFSYAERTASWLRLGFRQGLVIVLATTVLFIAAGFLTRRPGVLPALRDAAVRHRTAVLLILLSGFCFFGAITYGTFRPFERDDFGVFYDYQAEAVLRGHLDVPFEGIGGEGFVIGGKYYGYFGITPALLRLPIVAFDVPFGILTASFMVGYFVAALAGAYAILCFAKRSLLGSQSEPSVWAVSMLLVSAGLGSTLFFLAARPMMYHEAILCGIAFAVWSLWFSLRYLADPAARWWIGALICGMLATNARQTSGLFALVVLGVAAMARALIDLNRGAPRLKTWRQALAVGAGCLAGVLTFNGLAFLKFGTFDGAPLKYLYPPDRLAAIGGKKFHLENVPWGFYSYVTHANFRFEPRFPYFLIGASTPGATFPRAKIDLPDAQIAMPYTMPGLFALATIGAVLALVRAPRSRAPIAVLWLAAPPMSLAMFAFIATAQRYTGDFCPLLIGSAAVAVAALDEASGRWWTGFRAVLGALAAASVLITAALIFDYQGGWGPAMPESVRQRYQHFRARVDAFVGSRPQR